MCNDSLNDSDEIYNLYSFKNVTQTYKAQLQKLLNGNTNLPDKCCKTSNLTCRDESSLKKTKKTQPIRKKTKKLEESFIEDSESKSCSSDEELEIIAAIPRNGVRRSNRLRNKEINYRDDEYDFALNPQNLPSSFTKERKKRTKKQKVQSKQKPVPEEVILDESTLSSSNLEEEEINPELSVKVIWKSITVKRFLIRKFQKMSKVYQDLSKEEKVSESKIILTFNNSKVSYNDTPSSLNLQVYDFLEGGVLSESTNFSELPSEDFKNDNCTVVIKFQDSQKKTIKLALNKNDKIKVGMIKYSEQLEIPLKNIKFFFDGELLDSAENPQSLGLENDDIIDVKISN